jgi:hypothetical protein
MTENYYEFRSAVNGVTFYSSQETLAGEQDWLLSCVNSQRLWNNSSRPIDTEQYCMIILGVWDVNSLSLNWVYKILMVPCTTKG